MPTIVELIEDYNEGDFLDFKREEYGREKKHELIKDVLAFANSEHIGDRYIIIGIKKSGDEFEKFNIDVPEDSANIQSIIHDNIKPDLNVEYAPYIYKDTKLVILTIKNPLDKPYSTKKVVANPTGGIIYTENTFKIRKGSRIKDLSRDDLDRIYSDKLHKQPKFDGKVRLTFALNDGVTISLPSIESFELPSKIAIKQHHDQLIELENNLWQTSKNTSQSVKDSHKLREIRRIEGIISKIPENYSELDRYFIQETSAHKLQFYVYNSANYPLIDSKLVLNIEYFEGLKIMKQIATASSMTVKTANDYNYPQVLFDNDGNCAMLADTGKIQHYLKQEILFVAPRIYFEKSAIGLSIPIKCRLLAENLPEPLHFELTINVL